MSEAYNPHEVEVLAILLRHPETFLTVVNGITPEYFSSKWTGELLTLINELNAEGKPANLASVQLLTRDQDLMETVVASPARIEALDTLLDIIKDRHVRVKASSFARSLVSRLDHDNEYHLSDIQRDFDLFMRSSIFGDNGDDGPYAISDIFDGFRDGIINDLSAGSDYLARGISPYLGGLKDMIGTFAGGEIAAIAGRPSMGKSALVLDLARFNAMHNKHRGVFYSLEMSKELICLRLLSRHCGINLQALKTRRLLNEDIRKMFEPVACRDCGAENGIIEKIDVPSGVFILKCLSCGSNNVVSKSDTIKEISLIIDDHPGLSASKIAHKTKYLKSKHNDLSFIIVDYIQLLQLDETKSKNDEIGRATKILRNLAKELDIMVFIVSQLNRDIEKRIEKKPLLSDLRDSGEIEADMDYVIFVHRDYVYTKKEEDKYHADIILAKQRNGPTGVVPVGADLSIQKFYDVRNSYGS